VEKKELFAQELSQILCKNRVISESEAKALFRSFKNSDKETFDDFLLEEGLIEEEDLLKALGEYYKVPSVDVTGYFFDTALLQNFPKDFLLRNRVIPLEMDEDILIVAASEPDDMDLLSGFGAYTSEDIQFRVGLARDICDAVKEFYDKSPTDLLDDQDALEEDLYEHERYKDILHESEDEKGLTIKEEIDTDENE
jgi:hypothetical protein